MRIDGIASLFLNVEQCGRLLYFFLRRQTKMKLLISALILVALSIVAGQRPSFAGLSPIGYPPTPNRTTTTPDPLGDRFGEAEVLPIEANGDRDLIDRLSKLPVDKQPFWFINWQAYDKHRKDPQTFAQRPSSFVDPIPQNSNSGQAQGNPNTGSIATDPNAVFNRFASTTVSNQPIRNGDSSSNFNNNPNLNNGGNVVPKPISHINPTVNVYENPNAPTSSNANSNAFADRNGDVFGYPLGKPNAELSAYLAYLNRNNPSNYPVVNGNPNPAEYQTSSFNYPAVNGNPNPAEYQTSSFNLNPNIGNANKNGAFVQTTSTQKYQWTRSDTKDTNVKTYNGQDSYYN